MTNSPEKTEPSTTEDLKALLHEAEQALSNTTGEASDKFEELRSRLRAAISNGRYSLEQLRHDAKRRIQQADQLVRENPYYAVGVAAGVGAIVGLLVSRRCNNSR